MMNKCKTFSFWKRKEKLDLWIARATRGKISRICDGRKKTRRSLLLGFYIIHSVTFGSAMRRYFSLFSFIYVIYTSYEWKTISDNFRIPIQYLRTELCYFFFQMKRKWKSFKATKNFNLCRSLVQFFFMQEENEWAHAVPLLRLYVKFFEENEKVFLHKSFQIYIHYEDF